ncbi:MAG: TolC family protein [Steroidobacteraceae bacterium]
MAPVVSGILRIAYKLLVNDRIKFAALLVGITFAVFLLIEMPSVIAMMLFQAAFVALIGYGIGVGLCAALIALARVRRPDYAAIMLNGSTNSTAGVFPANGTGWSSGATATVPMFAGGSLWFRRRAANDAYQQSPAVYRRTVLLAVAQVTDTLQALKHDAQQALHLLQASYQAGLTTYRDVLSAAAQLHRAQSADLEAVALPYQDTVALFAALGGGWWNAAPPDSALSQAR